ncbi:hypothetical protein GQ54DRAFT_311074 [Martensiomyces pterosporus]|nr:hypothetical protein GQ54DRAFT_311074 [Martensiomyces pterosporus]
MTAETVSLLRANAKNTQEAPSGDAEAAIHEDASTSPPPISTEYSADAMALYEDGYIKVTRDGLRIFNYYFPLLTSRFIRWEAIEYVKTAKEADVKWHELKIWGTSLGNIWWGFKCRIVKSTATGLGVRSFNEILESNIVVKVRGSMIRPGSYVQYPEEAMLVIRKMVEKHHPHLHSD